MRRLFKNKSKFLAGICCLCLGVASLLAGAFSFVKAPAMAEEVADTAPGFYVEQGASIRYDDVVPGIRFAVSLTKAQWETFYAEGNYADDVEVVFKAEIHFANRLNQDGTPSSGYRVVDHTVTVKALNDYFAKAENVGKPFTVKPAILLSNAWKDAEGNETPKSQAELYKMYAEMEFYLTGAGIFVNEEPIIVKTVKSGLVEKDATLRSVRSVAASLLAKGAVSEANMEVTESFTKDANGVKADIAPVEIKAYYDKYINGAKIEKPEVEGLQVTDTTKVTIGSTKVLALEYDGQILVGLDNADILTDGKTYNVLVDQGEKIYSLKGLIAATEIFYQTNSKGEKGVARLNARFAQTKTLDDMKASAVVETIVKDGVEYSATFYDVDRGYYVLGEDIDFGAGWMKSVATTNSIYHTGGDYRSLSGLVGFGGTFDGNGHSLKNVRFNQNSNTTTPLGLFGNLAYGAKVKNLGMVDIHLRDVYHQKNNNTVAILANSTGYRGTASATAKDGTAAKDTYNYLVAKFGEDNWGVEIDNCYFGVDKTIKSELTSIPAPRGKYNNSEDPVFTFYKADITNYIYKQGQFGVTYEGEEGYITFKNSVLDLPKNNDRYGQNNNGGQGWISAVTFGGGFYNRYGSKANLGILENCYQITEEADTGRIMGGHNFNATIGYTTSGAWDTSTKAYIPTAYAEPEHIKLGTSITIYAANDFSEVTDGTKVYDWYDADTDKWLFCADAEELAELGKTANTTIYHYPGLNRYDNYLDMVLNNTASTEGFNENWSIAGGAVVWNGLAEEKTIEVELSKQTGEVGDVINVTATYGAEDATSILTLSTENSDILSIDNQKKEVTLIKGGEATLRVTANGYSAEYTIVASSTNKTAVTISSNHSAVYGLEDAYSVPYVLAENGKDLDATDFLSLYQNHFGDNDATISAVYLLDENGNKTALTAVEDANGVSQYLFANAGNVKKALSIIVDGTKGYMSFADISSVTAVVTDKYGFKYIPSNATTRSGYYVLANDFENATEETWAQSSFGKLGEMGYDGDNLRPMGYSFGGLDLEVLANIKKGMALGGTTTINSSTAEVYLYAHQAFTGTFDGLGHTINNLLVDVNGILGRFTDNKQTATLVNTIFTNVRSTNAYRYGYTEVYNGSGYWSGKELARGFRNTSYSAILAINSHAPYVKDNAVKYLAPYEDQIKLKNVVIEMATYGFIFDQAVYGATNVSYNPWAFVRYEKYIKDMTGEVAISNSTSNISWAHRISNQYNFENVILKYNKKDASFSYNDESCRDGYIFSYNNAANTTVVAAQSLYMFNENQMKGVYLITPLTDSGRMPIITSGRLSNNSVRQSLVILTRTDFDNMIKNNPEFEGAYYTVTNTELNTSMDTTWYTSAVNGVAMPAQPTAGIGYTTDAETGVTSKFFFVKNVAAYKEANANFTQQNLMAEVISTIQSSPFYRYDTYEAMATAGVTKVGNFAVTADGIVWSPAK